MLLENPLVDISGVDPLREPGFGWDPSAEVRIGISGADGSSSLAYHATLPPGAARLRHVNRNCDELLVYLEGTGIAGQAGGLARIRQGHCQFVPKGVEHFFKNTSAQEKTVILGFCPGAPDFAASGFEARAAVREEELRLPEKPFGAGLLVHLDAVGPAAMNEKDGWLISDFRIPIGRFNGSSSALFHPRFLPGAIHKKHRHLNCEEIYYLTAGEGVAGAGRDRVRIHGGQFHFVPKGVEHFLSNHSKTDPIEGFGVYIGAGSVEETGYQYTGEVGAEDLV